MTYSVHHKKCLEFPNKKRYNTLKDAEAIISFLRENLSAYKCDSCQGWHLTSKNK
jgi:hypothetical protein